MRYRTEEPTAGSELGFAATIRQKPIASDVLKSARQNVHEEAPNEFVGRQCHRLLHGSLLIVFPAERDLIIVHADEAMVGDGDAMGVASKVMENMFGATERP